MPYKLFSQPENHIIYFEIMGVFTVAEMYEACNRLNVEFLNKAVTTSHIIIDAKTVKSHPQDLRILRDATNIYSGNAKLGWMIFLGIESPITKYITNVLFQIVGTRFKSAKNLEEALAELSRIDASVLA